VLKNLNFSVSEGQTIGYVGRNGAGKTTTIKILTGLIDSFEGDIFLLGEDLKINKIDIKRQIGYVPENASIYNVLTPIEYLNFISKLYELPQKSILDKSIRLLELFDLSSYSNVRMTQFSKGMTQKIIFIAALIHNPKIIFLDEALNGLDTNTVMLVKEIIQQLKEAGKTIFYTSHVMDTIEKICDKIIIIEEGGV
jgi:ABC-2 type transport system ATP-binding protein